VQHCRDRPHLHTLLGSLLDRSWITQTAGITWEHPWDHMNCWGHLGGLLGSPGHTCTPEIIQPPGFTQEPSWIHPGALLGSPTL
jgi:hypothetical protein